ncbi:flagellar hook-length control protein FliK [Lacrimispora brassicae]
MAEVKNSSVDLLVRQMPAARKKEDKAVDAFSGFRTMLKNKNQKKDGGNEKAKESGNMAEGAGIEAAALMAAGAAETQNPVDMLRMMGQGLAQKLAEGPVTDNVQGVMQEEGEKGQVMDPFQTLNQLRFQNSSEKPGQETVVAEDGAATFLQEAEGTMPDAGLADKTGIPVTTDHKESAGFKESLGLEISGQADGPVPGQEGGRNASEALELKGMPETVQVRNQEETALPVQKGKAEEKTAFVEKNEKKPEENPEILRDNSYEPNRLLHIQPKKDEIVYTTVNAENLEGLEAKLSQQILKQIHEGRGELDVQLEPHNLGKIRIKVSYEDSQVSVSVLCSESRTLKLLSQSAGELGSILENNLERPVQILVDKQTADYLDNQKEQGSGQGQNQPQHENRKEESREDFIQKLRLGIFETGNTEDNETL